MADITRTNEANIRTPYGTFGNAVKVLRTKRGWTQVQLAKRLGVSQVAIAWYETGRSLPSLKNMRLLAIELNVPIELLLAHKRTLFGERTAR